MRSQKTGDLNLVKKINTSIVLNTIETRGPISRAQIAKDTGLNKATVSTLANDLMNDSLIYEIGTGNSNGGRKPVMLYYNNRAGFSIGIDLGVNYVLAVLTDLSGNILDTLTESLQEQSIEAAVRIIVNMISSLKDRAPESPYGIVGVGIGVPGIVNHEGEILFAPNLAWENVDLKKQIASQTGLVVTIENEANAGVYAEHLYGLSKGEANLVYVSIGIGIGTGIIINHELYRGSNGISGEMGHMTIEANGQKCRCGNRGCWELYASEKALLDKTDDQNLHVLEEKAKKGDAEVLQRLHDIGVNIGIGLVTIINTFNPEKIIIGNRLARFEPWLNNGIHRSLDQRLPTQNRQSTSVIYSRLGHYSCAKGTASFAIHHFLHEHRVFM